MNTLSFRPPIRKRNVIDPRRQQFTDSSSPQGKQDYPTCLNAYRTPPTADITLEQFEQWAIDRLRILAELEACSFRNKSPAETASTMKPLIAKYMPLDSNSSASSAERLHAQRMKDHYSHFILRLAFCGTEDLRRRFVRVETMLFRIRFADEPPIDRQRFVNSLGLDWQDIDDDERREFESELMAVAAFGYGGIRSLMRNEQAGGEDTASWKKVEWTRVPELVEQRRVFLRRGMAFVPVREQAAMVQNDFSSMLEKYMERTARALPRLDEDDRLTPILDHLSKNFVTPDSAYAGGATQVNGRAITARSIDGLVQHFPMCMANLHRSLRRDAHLKHYGRLQYTLFLKGIGLSLEECLVFWRSAFHKFTDDQFNKEYRYNVRHAYGDVGGDWNRRSGGYSPFGCQKILMEHPPGPGEPHGCPYRHFDAENLTALLQAGGIRDKAVLSGVMQDRERQKYHMACNRVFEHLHKNEIRRAKDEGIMTANELETIVHPNEYFKRSYLLKHMDDKPEAAQADVNMD